MLNIKSTTIRAVLVSALLATSIPALRSEIKLPGIFSDHMVLQREQTIPVWGTGDPNEKVTISFNGYQKTLRTGKDGSWRVEMPAQKAGGPYILTVNNQTIDDVYVGDVFLCSGQSNMELTVKRVMAKYKDEIENYENNLIRYTKTKYAYDFINPLDNSGNEWKICNQENVYDFSSFCYFFAKELQHDKNVAIGIINSSWGGTPIAAWSTKNALESHPQFREILESELFRNPNYPDSVKNADQKEMNQWYDRQHKEDSIKNLSAEEFAALDWQTKDIFKDKWGITEGKPSTGVYYFRKKINIPEKFSGKQAVLQVGTIKDADDTYVNGTLVGKTSYQYPPRIYNVAEGVLKGGENEIMIRLLCCNGRPFFVEGKPYQLEIGDTVLQLDPHWEMIRSCTMPPQPSSTSFQNQPVGLYNAMIHPLRDYAIKGMVWYQGESDCGMKQSQEYESHLTELVEDWRKQWKKPDMPFVVVQLANFQARSDKPMESGIANVREAQRKVASRDGKIGLATAIDLGESNDIHPLNKKDLAHRCILQFEKMAYGKKQITAEGPVPEKATYSKESGITISFRDEKNADSKLQAHPEIEDITVATGDGKFVNVKARTEGNNIIIPWESDEKPCRVRYAWQNNPPSTIYNVAGLPASSFELVIE